MLSEEEMDRYDRQIRIFGIEGQEKIKKSHIVVVGVGGLGSVVSKYLVAAGVGKITIIDKDVVELSDLNRQVLYDVDAIGKEKVFYAEKKLKKLNPHVTINPINMGLEYGKIRRIIHDADIVIDCLDNWSARHILNKACVDEGKILIHGGIRGLYGQVMVIVPRKTACLYCMARRKKDEEEVIPVLGTTPAVIGAIQAMEAIKIITGYGKPLIGRMLIFDGYSMEFDIVEVERDEKCPVCGRKEQ